MLTVELPTVHWYVGVRAPSSASEAVAEQVSSPVFVDPLAVILAVMLGRVLSTATEALEETVSPWSSVAVIVQLTTSDGRTVETVSWRVSEVEP